MNARANVRLGRPALVAGGVAILVLVSLSLGGMIPSQPLIPVAAGIAVLALGVTAVEPAAIPLMAMPLLLVVSRIGGGGIDLSVSDAALFAATLAAVVFTPRPLSAPLRNLLWLCALYQFTTLFTVVANPYRSNAIEWVHAALLVGGALLVGWTIGASGHARLGLALFMAGSMVIAWSTIGQALVQYAGGDFAPIYTAWPYGMHKNFVGTTLCYGAIVALVNPGWLAWPTSLARLTFWSCAAAIMATQSRQAIVALGVAIVFVAWRERRVKNRASLVLLGALPALAFAATMVQDQVESGNQFNSVFQRLTWFDEAVQAWLQRPWFGYGLRFWNQESSPVRFQPPNAELEVLASAGLVGLAGFVVFVLGTLVVLGRLDRRYGTLALTLVLSRVIQGQFDLFWTAVQVSVPFVIAGIAVGVMTREARSPVAYSRDAVLQEAQ